MEPKEKEVDLYRDTPVRYLGIDRALLSSLFTSCNFATIHQLPYESRVFFSFRNKSLLLI